MSGLPRPGALRARALPHLYRPLVALVVVGLGLRLLAMLGYSTVTADYYTGDAARYTRFFDPGVFADPYMPAGYPTFLATLRAVCDWLPLTVAVQHLLGVATALLLFGAARRAGAPRWAALAPAGLVLLSGDHLFLEHALLTETLWLAVIAAGLYAAVRGDAADDLRWLLAAGTLLALSALVRNVSLALPVVLMLWLVVRSGPRTRRARAGAAALGPALLLVPAYMLVANAAGTYSGIGEMSGWLLYGRVGQFADCRTFTPPEGTSGLCDRRPPAVRGGSFFYLFDPASPARAAFGEVAPGHSGDAGAFARAAIRAQPGAYLKAVAKDVVRYADAGAGADRPLSGYAPDDMAFRRRSADPAGAAVFASRLRTRYSGVDVTPQAATTVLESYQRVFRVGGLLLLAMVALTAAGLVRGSPSVRSGCALFGACAVVLLLVPPVVSSFDSRYAVPPSALLMVSAALGLSGLRRDVIASGDDERRTP